jgi:pyroglutamyl-peptidase
MNSLILLTGFEPFGEYSRNPSSEIGRALDESTLLGSRVKSLELPVDSARAPKQLIAALEELKPNAVLSLGLAGGRRVLSVEKIAVNLLNFEIPDNAGAKKHSELIEHDGPAAYFATLPVEELVHAIREAGVPSDLSMSAGGFLCNQIMYASLHYFAERGLRCPSGFIHMPALPEMVVNDPSLASMSFETIGRGVQAALKIIATKLDSSSI